MRVRLTLLPHPHRSKQARKGDTPVLVVKIELWPLGSEEHKRDLGIAFIANDASGDHETGNYKFKLMKSPEYAKRPGVWKQGRVGSFPRRRLGPWDLLYRVLQESVGYRNRPPSPRSQNTGRVA